MQIDVIFSLDTKELNFKKEFLNLPAEKQGLILGLAKAAMLDESKHQNIFSVIGIPYVKLTDPNQEYDITLSSVALTIDKITYEDRVSYKVAGKENLAKITDWNKIVDIIHNVIEDAINMSFEDLLAKIKEKDWKGDRALKRIAGTFKSMISIKSGEVGTPKGDRKAETLAKVAALVEESMFDRYVRTVMTENFATFPTTTKGLELDDDMKKIVSILLTLDPIKNFISVKKYSPIGLDLSAPSMRRTIKINRKLWEPSVINIIKNAIKSTDSSAIVSDIIKERKITGVGIKLTNKGILKIISGSGTPPGKVDKGLDYENKVEDEVLHMIENKTGTGGEKAIAIEILLKKLNKKPSDISKYHNTSRGDTERGSKWDGINFTLEKNTAKNIADGVITISGKEYYLSMKYGPHRLLNAGIASIFNPDISDADEISSFLEYFGLNQKGVYSLYNVYPEIQDEWDELKYVYEDKTELSKKLLYLTKLAWGHGYWKIFEKKGTGPVIDRSYAQEITPDFVESISGIDIKKVSYPEEGKRKEIAVIYNFTANEKKYKAELKIRNTQGGMIPDKLNINIIE